MVIRMYKAYKIVKRDKDNEKLKTLFKGINGSRLLRCGEWLQAEIKQGRDGGDSPYYTTGFHVLATDEHA